MSKHMYFCPVCDGQGVTTTNESWDNDPQCDVVKDCYTCDGTGIVPESVAWDNFTIHGLPREYTPSHRRWMPATLGGIEAIERRLLRSRPDPLLELRDARKRYRGKVGYSDAKQHAIGNLSHTYAGLACADMLAHLTMTATAGDSAANAWRAVA